MRISALRAAFRRRGLRREPRRRQRAAPSPRPPGTPTASPTAVDFNTAHRSRPLRTAGVPPVEPVTRRLRRPAARLGRQPDASAECTLVSSPTAIALTPSRCARPPPRSAPSTCASTAAERVQHSLGPFPIFNMEPPPGVPARFGFNVVGTVVCGRRRAAHRRRLRAHGGAAKGLPRGCRVAGVARDPLGRPGRSQSTTPNGPAQANAVPSEGGPTLHRRAPTRRPSCACRPAAPRRLPFSQRRLLVQPRLAGRTARPRLGSLGHLPCSCPATRCASEPEHLGPQWRDGLRGSPGQGQALSACRPRSTPRPRRASTSTSRSPTPASRTRPASPPPTSRTSRSPCPRG